MDYTTAEYLLASNLPCSHVETNAFKNYAKINPNQPIPTARAMQHVFLEYYAALRMDLEGYFNKHTGKVALSLDGWSNPSLTDWVVVRLHWRDEATMEKHEAVIDVFAKLSGPRSCEGCAEYIFDLVKSWEMESKLIAYVVDGVPDPVRTGKALAHLLATAGNTSFFPLQSSGHAFKEGVEMLLDRVEEPIQKLRLCLTIIHKSEEKRIEFLRLIAENEQIQDDTIIPSIDARNKWESTCKMISRCLPLRIVFEQLSQNPNFAHDFTDISLSESEWSNLAQVCVFLEFNSTLSQIMSTNACPTLGQVAKFFSMLCEDARALDTSSLFVRSLSESVLSIYSSHSETSQSVPAFLSMFLDPRFSRTFFSQADIDRSREKLGEYASSADFKPFPQPSLKSECDNECSTKIAKLFGDWKEETLDQEISKFLTMPQVHPRDNIATWWLERKSSFPRLARIALDLLVIPAPSFRLDKSDFIPGPVWEGFEGAADAMFKLARCTNSWLNLAPQLGFDISAERLRVSCPLTGEIYTRDPILHALAPLGITRQSTASGIENTWNNPRPVFAFGTFGSAKYS